MSGITKFVLGLALFACFVHPSHAFANSVAPEAQDLSLQPGETADTVVSIFNNETEPVSYHADVVGVVLDQDGGGLTINTDAEFVRWTQLSESQFILNPGEEKDVTVHVAVPESADSHVVTGGVRFVEDARNNGDIRITSGFISLLFLTVEGDIQGSYEVLDFDTSSSVVTHLPATFTLTLRNDGERIVQPTGTIQMIDLFGKSVWSTDVNKKNLRVLPGQVRAFSNVITSEEIGFILPGVYKIKVQAAAWPSSEEFTQELTVVYLPWRGLIVVGLFLAAFFLILKKLNVSRRRL